MSQPAVPRCAVPAPLCRPPRLLGRGEGRLPRVHVRVAALFGLQYEAAAAVQIDAAGRAVGQRHRFFEHVRVRRVVGRGRMRPLDLQHVAQLGEEELVVGALRRSGGLPAGDEGGDGGRLVGHSWKDSLAMGLRRCSVGGEVI